MKKSREDLVKTLRDMANVVEANDSFEGSIEYTCMRDGLGPNEFEVGACYRIGNSMGQGGVCLIKAAPEGEEVR
jgi:hypothetical protein